MKKLLLSSLLCVASFCAEEDRLIAQIFERRGLTSQEIAAIKNPFLEQKEVKKTTSQAKAKTQSVEEPAEERPTFAITATFDESALINGKWVKTGDRMDGGYEVAKVYQNGATLKNDKNEINIHIKKGR